MQSELITAPRQARQHHPRRAISACALACATPSPWPWTHPRQQPLTILGELVHNETVLADLRARGIASKTTAASRHASGHDHGPRRLGKALARRASAAWNVSKPLARWSIMPIAPSKLAREGFHPVIIGRRGHVEVRGLTGDLAEFDVV